MRTNKQKLNDEVVLFGMGQQMEKFKENDAFAIKIGSGKIKPSPSAKILGFYMESQLKHTEQKSMAQHTTHVLKNVARIHNLLTPAVAKTIKNLRKFDHITEAMKDPHLTENSKAHSNFRSDFREYQFLFGA